MFIRECSDFDSQGFPHYITEIHYDKNGNFKEKSVYRITKVELNPSINNEVFASNPPEDYQIMETDANGISSVIRERPFDAAMRKLLEARKKKDVDTLKGLLGHEMWKMRLMSLQALEPLLAQDMKGLKEVATILENDENPSVREQAGKILRRIKTMESGTSSSKQ